LGRGRHREEAVASQIHVNFSNRAQTKIAFIVPLESSQFSTTQWPRVSVQVVVPSECLVCTRPGIGLDAHACSVIRTYGPGVSRRPSLVGGSEHGGDFGKQPCTRSLRPRCRTDPRLLSKGLDAIFREIKHASPLNAVVALLQIPASFEWKTQDEVG